MSERHGPSRPTKTSEIAPATDKTEDELLKEKAQAAVRARLARRQALRNMGAIGPGSDDLAGRIEHGLGKREADIMREFRKGKQ